MQPLITAFSYTDDIAQGKTIVDEIAAVSYTHLVWTMPRKTSCCNGTLLRSDVRHYGPAGFLYVLVWLMILPIPCLLYTSAWHWSIS